MLYVYGMGMIGRVLFVVHLIGPQKAAKLRFLIMACSMDAMSVDS